MQEQVIICSPFPIFALHLSQSVIRLLLTSIGHSPFFSNFFSSLLKFILTINPLLFIHAFDTSILLVTEISTVPLVQWQNELTRSSERLQEWKVQQKIALLREHERLNELEALASSRQNQFEERLNAVLDSSSHSKEEASVLSRLVQVCIVFLCDPFEHFFSLKKYCWWCCRISRSRLTSYVQHMQSTLLHFESSMRLVGKKLRRTSC